MKKLYEQLELDIVLLSLDDVVTASGEVEDDETKYPIPGGWGQ